MDTHGPLRDSETWDDFPFDGRRLRLRDFQIVGGLQDHPHLRGGPEIVRQAHRCVSRDRASAIDDQIHGPKNLTGLTRF